MEVEEWEWEADMGGGVLGWAVLDMEEEEDLGEQDTEWGGEGGARMNFGMIVWLLGGMRFCRIMRRARDLIDDWWIG